MVAAPITRWRRGRSLVLTALASSCLSGSIWARGPLGASGTAISLGTTSLSGVSMGCMAIILARWSPVVQANVLGSVEPAAEGAGFERRRRDAVSVHLPGRGRRRQDGAA